MIDSALPCVAHARSSASLRPTCSALLMADSPSVPPSPYYQDDSCTIYHGDCRELFDVWDLAGAVMVTDPPYGVDYASNRGGKFLRAAVAGDEAVRLRDEILNRWLGPALVFGSWKVPKPSAARQTLVWDKGDHVGMGDLSMPWKPNTEEVYVLGTGFVGHRGSSVLRYNAPSPNFTPDVRRRHPTEKPVDLMRDLVGKCPPLAEIVDPFMGSGTTLRAAKDLGRKAIGIEIEERYCEIAAKRLAQEVLAL